MAQVPAADRGLAILKCLSRQGSPVSAAAISRSLELPRSTTYHLLNALIDAGFVAHYPHERVYGLGLAVYEIAGGYMRQEPL